MPLTAFQAKKESIKVDARLNKYSVWYMDTVDRPVLEREDQINGKLWTGVEAGINKYYGERQTLNGKTANTRMGSWNATSSGSPWQLSRTSSDFSTFPTLTNQYIEMNVYKPSPYVYTNGTSGSGNGGIKGDVTSLASVSDQLLNGYVFSGSVQGSSRWSRATTVQLKRSIISPPGPYDRLYISGDMLAAGKYYIEAGSVEYLVNISPRMAISNPTANPKHWRYAWLGYYSYSTDVLVGSLSNWYSSKSGTIYNYYAWSNSQRTGGTTNAWTTWSEFGVALTAYYNVISGMITAVNALDPILLDIIDYYKDTTELVTGEDELNWAILGGTGTWDVPNDIAYGWTETNAFYTEVTTGGGSGSWASQLTPQLPGSPGVAGPKYSDSEINTTNTMANDFKTKITSRVTSVENDILGTLSPATADGSFSALRAIRYLWTDSRLNKSGGTLLKKYSNYSGVDILTKKSNLLNNQLTSLNIPDNEREPRTAEVDCSRMEYTDRIVVSWKMVMQTTQYVIYRFDAGTGDAGRLYNVEDGPPDNLFTLLEAIDGLDADDLPVIRYIDDDVSLVVDHYYYYKVKVKHDGYGFPPPYDGNANATSPENATEGFLSLNFYDTKVWRDSGGNSVPGFLNSGALKE